ncbi:hypothetical protein PENDEC_c010G05131 [Penicillium decumbens]|uniref:Uncharacterized protein n=1 Tax=Penicillium decumbens TaxID=69771 RepID=A0A1V6PD02_PENDC|nr:hypothetical protein PENDEC_c010G05131 [Penicillium decumbens]
MPRTWILQFRLSATEREKLPWSSTIPEKRKRTGTPPEDPPTTKKRKTQKRQPTKCKTTKSQTNKRQTNKRKVAASSSPSSVSPPSGGRMSWSPPSHNPSFDSGPPNTPPVLPAQFDPRPIREAVERAIMKYTYRDLERHPSAPYKGPIPHRVAKSLDDLEIVQFGAFPSIDYVKLNLDLQFDENGYPFPYRGRGPVWANNSCVIDSTIVLGKLLDAGCTAADRGDTNGEHFTELEKAFVEVTNMNWDVFDVATSIELRDAFWRVLCDHVPSLRMGSGCPPWTPWAECTKNFAQFKFDYTTIINECHCQGSRVEQHAGTGRVLNPVMEDGDRTGVTVPQLWARVFPQYTPCHCERCGAGPDNDGPSISKRVDKLPLRLVVQAEQGTKVFAHTRDQILHYQDSQGIMQKAAYRWLGGIYHRGQHARVYWTESKRFEIPSKNYMMYDGMRASGVMISMETPGDEDEIVPIDWVHDPNNVSIWVYERILDPEPSTLMTASTTVSQMGGWFKYTHVPWNPLPGPPPFNDKPRQLPAFGDHFLDLKRPNPWDTIPDTAEELRIPDYSSFLNIDPNRDIAGRFKDMSADIASLAPVNSLNPYPPGAGFAFDNMFGGPQSFTNLPDLWPAGTRDATGALDFPDLASPSMSPDSGPASSGVNRPATVGDLIRATRSKSRSPAWTYTGRQTRSQSRSPTWSRTGRQTRMQTRMMANDEDDIMEDAPPVVERDVFEMYTTISAASSHCRAEPSREPKLILISPKRGKRSMREQILIKNAKKATKVTKSTKVGGKAERKGKDASNKKNRPMDKRGTSKTK